MKTYLVTTALCWDKTLTIKLINSHNIKADSEQEATTKAIQENDCMKFIKEGWRVVLTGAIECTSVFP
jgi:hypothetical protein